MLPVNPQERTKILLDRVKAFFERENAKAMALMAAERAALESLKQLPERK